MYCGMASVYVLKSRANCIAVNIKPLYLISVFESTNAAIPENITVSAVPATAIKTVLNI